MDTTTDTAPVAIETSASANLEVATPSTSDNSSSDWASNLDNLFDKLNKEEKEARENPEKKVTKTSKAKAKVEVAKDTEEVSKDAEPKPEADKEEVAKTEEKSEEPTNFTDKARIKWGELKDQASKAESYAKEIETLKGEIEKIKTQAPDTYEVERLRQINQEYESELAVARVEATQEYKAHVVNPMVNVVGYLNSLAEKYELNPKEMLAAFAESDPNKQSDIIADIAASMNERDRLRFYASADDYSEIMRRRDLFQNNSRERMAAIEAQRQSELAQQEETSAKSVAEAKAAYEKASSKVFEDLKKSVPVLSEEEIASDVQRLAKGDYTNADPELKAYLAHSGALLPHLLKALKSAKADLDKANKTIVGYRNGSPKAGSGTSDGSKSMPDDIGFLEALDQQLG